MKWGTGLEVLTFLLCSQARMRIGGRGLKDSIFPVPLPAMILLPMITIAHPTCWYFSLKVLSLPSHVPLNSCCLISAFSHLSCLPQCPLLCCCLFWNYGIWLLSTRTARLFRKILSTPQLTFLLFSPQILSWEPVLWCLHCIKWSHSSGELQPPAGTVIRLYSVFLWCFTFSTAVIHSFLMHVKK